MEDFERRKAEAGEEDADKVSGVHRFHFSVHSPRCHRRHRCSRSMPQMPPISPMSPISFLFEDFTDPTEIEATRAYLGGDAEHSILVKGLDYALLAARKAELAREQDEGMEDELDELGKGLGRRPEGKSKGKEEVRPEEKLGNRVSRRVFLT